MNPALLGRLREATVVLSQAEFERYSAGVEKITAGNPSMDDQLTRLRLSFGLEIGHDGRAGIDDQLAAAGIEVGLRDCQRRRVLAACILAARFERLPGRRRQAALLPDTAAALGARILTRAGITPVHPDVSSWAHYWLEMLSRHLRSTTRLPEPPHFSAETPTLNEALPIHQAAQEAMQVLGVNFAKFVDELVDWTNDLDPAQVAAQGEQIELLWWLESAPSEAPPADAAICAARELMHRTRRVPGPPGADQLFRRRLRSWSDAQVSTDELMTMLEEQAPPEVIDLCPLLSGDERAAGRTLNVFAAAEWVFDELMMARLTQEAS